MLVALIMTVCSVTDPNSCKIQEFTFEAHGDLRSCMFEAQPFIAEWSGKHPDLKVAKWKCAWPGAGDGNI
jgi:hypothetical protein